MSLTKKGETTPKDAKSRKGGEAPTRKAPKGK